MHITIGEQLFQHLKINYKQVKERDLTPESIGYSAVP